MEDVHDFLKIGSLRGSSDNNAGVKFFESSCSERQSREPCLSGTAVKPSGFHLHRKENHVNIYRYEQIYRCLPIATVQMLANMHKVAARTGCNPIVAQLEPRPYTSEHALHHRLLALNHVNATSAGSVFLNRLRQSS